MTLPEWMNETRTTHEPPKGTGSPGRRSFWIRTLESLAGTLRREMAAGESAERDGFLQALDPRAKLAGTCALVVAVTMVHSAPLLLVSITLALSLASASKVDTRTFLRALSPVVILSVCLSAPSVLSVVTPGHPLAAVGGVSVTSEGLHAAMVLVLGAAACIAWVSLLMLTTGWPKVLWAVRSLGVPRIFVLVLLMMYRYLFVMLRNAEEMHLAKESRTMRADRSTPNRDWVAGRMGDLFLRARRLSDQVYLSMTSRGFTGEPRLLETAGIDCRNVFWVVLSVFAAAALVIVDRLAV
jgi:cobalt ECF transporter T component CbiQ